MMTPTWLQAARNRRRESHSCCDVLGRDSILTDQIFFVSTSDVDAGSHKPDVSKCPSGPKPLAQYAIARALLAFDRPATQNELATAAGVSQASASRALKKLDAFVGETKGGKLATQRRELFDFAEAYPGAGGTTSYWWRSTELNKQWEHISQNRDLMLSGDLAAERYPGWRRPEHVVAYAHGHPDLSTDGFVMADASDYTVAITVPADLTLFATGRVFGRGVADPVIAALDVRRTGTTGDENEAADILREWTLRDGRVSQ